MDAILSLPGLYHPFSSVSHLAGAIIFACLSYDLLRPVWNNRRRFISVATFALAAVVLLGTSGVYHMFQPGGPLKVIMLRLDLAAIFVLIAATFTPVHVLLFRGLNRWGVLLLVWSIAISGILVRMIYFDSISRQSGAVIFLSMGWIGGYTAWLLARSDARKLLLPAVAGGVLYSLGAITNATGWPTMIPGIWGPHETLHLAVLGGLACHWAVVSGAIDHHHSRRMVIAGPIGQMTDSAAKSNDLESQSRAA